VSLRAGRYEILRPIASGGMATVHLGRAVGPGGFERRVAIKTMLPGLAAQADFVDMFLDEARLSARVHHPNVVATLDVQQDDEGVFLVMEYIDGFSLRTILDASRRQGRVLSFGLTLRIFLDLLAGLHAAHELTDGEGRPLAVIHRDVSPHNILVGADGITRITDFGIAHAEARLTSTIEGLVKGKLRYMAPEQLGDEEIDRRTDLYSAGAVLWEMLAGHVLVSGETDGDYLLAIGNPVKESPRVRNPEAPEPIAQVCLRALRLSPDDRYATAEAFAEALDAAAIASGITVASTRDLSMFVRALRASSLDGAAGGPKPPRSAMLAPLEQQAHGAPTASPARDVASPAATGPGRPTITDGEPPTMTGSDRPTITDSDRPTRTDADRPTITDADRPTITDAGRPASTGAGSPAPLDRGEKTTFELALRSPPGREAATFTDFGPPPPARPRDQTILEVEPPDDEASQARALRGEKRRSGSRSSWWPSSRWAPRSSRCEGRPASHRKSRSSRPRPRLRSPWP
jgi:serine/threonine-protein kinase